MTEVARPIDLQVNAKPVDQAVVSLASLVRGSGAAETAITSLGKGAKTATETLGELGRTSTVIAPVDQALRSVEAATRMVTQATTGASSAARQMAEAINATNAALVAEARAATAAVTATTQVAASAKKASLSFIDFHDAAQRNFATQYVGQMARVSASHTAGSTSSKALTQATLNLTRQFADVGVTAAMGMNPLMILIQQGPQIADGFQMAATQGVTFNAVLKGLTSTLVPFLGAAAAIGAVVGGVGLLGAAFLAGEKDSNNFANAVALTGNYANISAGQYEGLVRSIGAADGSFGKARSTLLALIQTGQFTGQTVGILADDIVQLSRRTGQTAEEVTANFTKMGKNVGDFAVEFDRQYHMLTAAQLGHIRLLEDQGRVTEAQLQLSIAIHQRLGEIAPESLGFVERAWRSLTGAISSAWEMAKNFGNETAGRDRQAALLEAGIKNMDSAYNRQLPNHDAILASMKKELAALQAVGAAQKTNTVDEQAAKDASEEHRRTWGAIGDNVARATAEIAKYKAGQEAIRKKDPNSAELDSAKRSADIIAGIMKKNTPEATAAANKAQSAAESAAKASKERGEALAREVKSMEENTSGQYALAAAYLVSGSAALKAEADRKGSTDAAKKDGRDPVAQSARQLALDVAEANAQGSKLARTTYDQAAAQTVANAAVTAGTLTYGEAAQAMQLQQRLLPYNIALDAASADKKDEVRKTIAAVTDATLKLNDAEKLSALQSAGVDQKDQNDLLKAELGLINATTRERAIALAGLKAELDVRRLLDGVKDPAARAQIVAEGVKHVDSAKEGARLADTLQNGKTSLLDQGQEYLDQLGRIQDRTTKAAAAMSAAWGGVGASIGGLVTVLTGYAAVQKQIGQDRAKDIAQADGDPKRLAAAEIEAIDRRRDAQLSYYGDVAGAAKGFFKQGSDGYRALQVVETTYRAVELAMSVRSLFAKTAETAATVAGEGAKTTSVVAGSLVRASAKAAEGAAGMFATLGPAGFAAVAAMAAVLASFGLRGGSGGAVPGATDAADRQKAQGTGSLLGDAAAKSASIASSLTLVAEHTNKDLEYSNQMLKSLRSIDSSIGAVANALARTLSAGGALSTDGLNLGSTTSKGGLVGRGVGAAGGLALGGLAGGAVINAGLGLAMGGALGGGLVAAGSLLGPIGAVIGAVLGPLLFSGKQTRTLQDQGLQFNDQSVGDIMSGGVSGDSYQQVLTNTKKKFLGITYSNKNTSSVETTALDDELNKQITLLIGNLKTGVLSAANVLGVTGAEATLNAFVVSIGKISLKDLSSSEISDALNAVFSKVGDDLAGAAIPGLEAVQKAGEGLFETLARVARDYQVVDVTLSVIGKTFNTVGLASLAARERLIDLAGGLDAFTEQTQAFADAFLSKDEQIAPVIAAVDKAMAGLGLSGIKTKDQFKQLVLGLDVSTEAGAATYAALLQVAPAFAQVQDYLAALSGVANDNVSLTDRITAAHSALADAYDRESSALRDTITTFTDLAKSLNVYGNSLGAGSAGNLSPFAQAAAAKALFEQTDAAARGGDKTAAGQLQSVGEAYIAAQKVIAPTAQAVTQVVSAVRASVYAAAGAAQGQADAAQQQLDLLGKSVDGLLAVNASVLSVRDAILALTGLNAQAAAITGIPTAALAPAGFNATGYATKNPDVEAAYQQYAAGGGYYSQFFDKGLTEAQFLAEHYNLTGKGEGRGFATGGDGIVGGSGGTDSKMISFRATPGELVSVRTPGQASSNADMVNEIRALRADLNAALDAIAMNTSKSVRQIDKLSDGGAALRTVAA